MTRRKSALILFALVTAVFVGGSYPVGALGAGTATGSGPSGAVAEVNDWGFQTQASLADSAQQDEEGYEVELNKSSVGAGAAEMVEVEVSSSEDGSSVEGATISVSGENVTTNNPTTGSDGTAVLEVNASTPGELTVTAEKNNVTGSATLEAIPIIVVKASPNEIIRDVNEDLTVTLTYKHNGEAVQNADVTMEGAGVSRSRTVNGEATLNNFSAPESGTLYINASKEDAVMGSAQVEIAQPSLSVSSSHVKLPLERNKKVTVTVTYSHNGQPVEGVDVSASGAGVADSATTNEKGKAVLTLKPTEEATKEGGEVKIEATSPDAESDETSLDVVGLYIFGMSSVNLPYWGLLSLIALALVGLVVLNQVVNDTFILKD